MKDAKAVWIRFEWGVLGGGEIKLPNHMCHSSGPEARATPILGNHSRDLISEPCRAICSFLPSYPSFQLLRNAVKTAFLSSCYQDRVSEPDAVALCARAHMCVRWRKESRFTSPTLEVQEQSLILSGTNCILQCDSQLPRPRMHFSVIQ